MNIAIGKCQTSTTFPLCYNLFHVNWVSFHSNVCHIQIYMWWWYHLEAHLSLLESLDCIGALVFLSWIKQMRVRVVIKSIFPVLFQNICWSGKNYCSTPCSMSVLACPLYVADKRCSSAHNLNSKSHLSTSIYLHSKTTSQVHFGSPLQVLKILSKKDFRKETCKNNLLFILKVL